MNLTNSTNNGGNRRAGDWCCLRLVAFVAPLLFASLQAEAASPAFTDNFADRELLTDASGTLDGSNVGATRESNEPRHGGKTGGRSVWISWLAPADGIATFKTDGSTFDTLLSAYYFSSASDTTLDKLHEVARNDDASVMAAPLSLIQFGARAGVAYHIAVDGYAGAAGSVRLRWEFVNATSPPPVVVSVPDDQALREGDPVSLKVDIETSSNLRLQWRHNGGSFGAEGATLTIPSFQTGDVGRYTLRIDLGDVRFETSPVELQINSDGQTNALARDKLLDALNSPLVPEDGGGGGFLRAAAGQIVAAAGGVSRGYNGSQVFNTTYATPDPEEPQHCGLTGSASYWYAYTAPADGTLTLDTIGSSFDTYLAVYTYNSPFNSYADLIPIICDNDSAGTNGAARLEFAAPKNRQFLVVLDGINDARGIARLNYRLDTNRPPVAPMLAAAQSPVLAALGDDITLQPAIVGSPPLRFAWRKGSSAINDATNSGLTLLNLSVAHSGDYFVTVSSYVGEPLEVRMPLRVLIPPGLRVLTEPDGLIRLTFDNVAGQSYILEHTDNLGGTWQALTNGYLSDGAAITLTNSMDGSSHFFRLRVD